VENGENQNQVSLRFPPPLEIVAAIPTFPQPLCRVEKWKTKSRFPTFPLVVFVSQIQSRKEAWRRIASLPPSGSFFNERMLVLEARFFRDLEGHAFARRSRKIVSRVLSTTGWKLCGAAFWRDDSKLHLFLNSPTGCSCWTSRPAGGFPPLTLSQFSTAQSRDAIFPDKPPKLNRTALCRSSGPIRIRTRRKARTISII
jgi:hypothetical protein